MQANRQVQAHRSQSGHENLYNTAAWRKLRKQQLTVEALCRMCLAEGRTTAANTGDHVVPHRGDPDLFWAGPFQSLCATCHSLFKQSQERGGTKHLRGCDEHGELLSELLSGQWTSKPSKEIIMGKLATKRGREDEEACALALP